MHRPLETTFWMRFTRFLKGVFLYNTIYWRRASDDLDIRHMSREERAGLRPKRDLEIIRPREKPRPTSAPTSPLSSEASEPTRSVPAAVEPVRRVERSPEPPFPAFTGEEGGLEIRRRKKRRRGRHSSVIPKKYHDAEGEGGGFLGWLFKK